jgi:hypothetical protein
MAIHGNLLDGEKAPTFSISMIEVASDTTGFHTQNDPKNAWQRQTVIERNNGRVSASCVCKDVVHGFYAEGAEDEDEASQQCSLIVLHFRFDPVDLGRRIKKVQTTIRFSAVDRDGDDPVVDKISSDGFFWVYPTTQKETVTLGVTGKLGGNVLGGEVGGELKRERTIEKQAMNAGTVRGAIQTIGRNYGEPNAASWTLMENPEDKTGVPVGLRASILVKRDPGVDFQAHFSMVVTPDNRTQAQTFFKSDPKDDPVLFKVDKKPTNKLHNYLTETIDAAKKRRMVNNLGRLDLDSREFTDITFRTIWQDGKKVARGGGSKLG